MTSSLKFIGALAALATATLSFAQAEAPNAGLLGKRYVETGFSYLDFNHSSTEVYGLDVSANFPVLANVDVGVGYVYDWEGGNSDINGHAIAAAATGYQAFGSLNGFATVGLGYDWNDQISEETFWFADVGIEHSLSSTVSLLASAGYSDDFDGPSNDGLWDGTLRGNYWVTEAISTNVSVSLIEGGHIGSRVGVVFTF